MQRRAAAPRVLSLVLLQFADHLLENATFVHGPLSLFAQVSDLVAASARLDEDGQRRGGRHVGQLLQSSAR